MTFLKYLRNVGSLDVSLGLNKPYYPKLIPSPLGMGKLSANRRCCLVKAMRLGAGH